MTIFVERMKILREKLGVVRPRRGIPNGGVEVIRLARVQAYPLGPRTGTITAHGSDFQHVKILRVHSC